MSGDWALLGTGPWPLLFECVKERDITIIATWRMRGKLQISDELIQNYFNKTNTTQAALSRKMLARNKDK